MRKDLSLSEKEALFFCQQLSFLLRAGLVVQDCLEILKDSAGGKLKELCLKVKKSILEGKSFCQAAEPYKKSFGGNFIALLKVGEESGRLTQILYSYSVYLEEKINVHKKIKSSLVYPFLVLLTLVFAAIIIFAYVFPQLEGIFEVFFESDERVKAEAQRLFAAIIFRAALAAVFVSILLICVFLYGINGRVRYFFDRTIVKLPFFGKVIKEIYAGDFSFSMHILLEGGITFVRGIALAVQTVKNTYFSEQLKKTEEKIRGGMNAGKAFKEAEVFPEYFVSWLTLSCVTGDIESSFEKIYGYYREEISEMVKSVSSALESAFIILTGLIVFDFALNFVLPVFNLIGSI